MKSLVKVPVAPVRHKNVNHPGSKQILGGKPRLSVLCGDTTFIATIHMIADQLLTQK